MIMKINTKIRKALLISYGISVFALSIYFLYFFLRQKGYVINEDCIYYMAIADSILQSGVMLNMTTIPASPVITPQNGIVVIHLVLSLLGLEHESRLIAIVIINYLLHLSAIYPLYKIARRVGLVKTLPLAALLGLYTCAYHLYRYQLLPFNDGVYNSLVIWLVYLLLNLCNAVEPQSPHPRLRSNLLLSLVLTAFLIHLRLQTFFVIGTALVTALVSRNYRFSVYTLGLLAVAIVSLALPYFWVDTSRIFFETNKYVANSVVLGSDFSAMLVSKCQNWCNKVIPNVLLADLGWPMNLIYVAFAVAAVMALQTGFRQKQFGVLFVALLCLVNVIGMIFFIGALPRYISYLFPFLYLIILLPLRMRPIGYVFIALVFILSLVKLRFINNIPPPEHNKFWQYLYEKRPNLNIENPLMLSDEAPSVYLIYRVRSFAGELTLEQILNHRSLLLCGGQELRSFYLPKIQRLLGEANYSFKTENLTPEYSDDQGNMFIKLYDFAHQEP